MSASSSSPSSSYTPTRAQHLHYLRQTIDLARLSPPKPTNFRVGCVLVSYPSTTTTTTTSSSTSPSSPTAPSSPTVLSTGYTLQLPGNTHAEQNALALLLTSTTPPTPLSHLHTLLPSTSNVYLYTSLEPCSLRLSGSTPCVQRIISTRDNAGCGIRKVIFGAKEPNTFVRDSRSCKMMDEAGVEWEYIDEFEGEILGIAMEGHVKKEERKEKGDGEGGERPVDLHSRVDLGLEGERNGKEERGGREEVEVEAQTRNPKKRMMECLT